MTRTPTHPRTRTGRPVASVSLDLDNLWSYLHTHGDPAWRARPSFLPAAVPRLLALFADHDVRPTVFVVGADAAREDGAAAVAAFVAAGHEIGNHSWSHEPWLHHLSRAELAVELELTEDALVAAGAPRPVGFRGPGFSVTPDLLDVLVERGYRYDTSTLPTWIGPLARAFHDRGLGPDRDDDARGLFGPSRDALLPLRPHRCRAGLVELPVTTMPVVRVPIHGSYLLQVHARSPRLARTYLRAALALCRSRDIAPTLLLHPTDVLDRREAPGLEFFPGMTVPGEEKAALVDWVLGTLRADFDVVGTGELADRVAGVPPVPVPVAAS